MTSVRMQKWISKGAWNSDVEDDCTETRQAKEMDTFQGEDDDLLLSIEKLVEEVELSLKQWDSSFHSEDSGWKMDTRLIDEDYEQFHQQILDCRKHMERHSHMMKEDQEQPSDGQSGDEEPSGEAAHTGHLQKRRDASADPPEPNVSKHTEPRGSSRGRKASAAEPHVETDKSKLLWEEKPQAFYQKERWKLLLEAELQQERMKNKAIQEELDKVKVSCANEIQKHKAQLHSVRQQLESLQQVHQKDFQKALKEQSELSKQEARKAKAAYESELQTWKDKLENYRQQNDILQRDLRRALETGGRGQSSLQVPLDLQPSQKDLNTFKHQMDSSRRNSRCALQSTKSSLFSRGLSGMEMLSNRNLSQSFKNTEKKVRSSVLSLQSKLESSRNEIWQEKELCKRLQREKESIQKSYKEQQNELNYTKRRFDSMRAQLEDYKKKIESKTEEADHLRNDLKKVKKFCKKRYESRSRSRTGGAEDGSQTNTPQSKEKKRRVGDDGPRDRRAGLEPLAEKKKHSQKGQRKASQRADPQTSPEPHKSIFKTVRHVFGLRKPKK